MQTAPKATKELKDLMKIDDLNFEDANTVPIFISTDTIKDALS